MKTYSFILLLVLFFSTSFSQDKQKEFVEALISGVDNLEKFVDDGELSSSKRLCINYDGIKYKFIISFDIDEKIKDEIKKNNLKYEIKKSDLGNGYSIAELTVPSLNYSKQFYFKNGKWISPISYFSKDWTTKTSKYFIFKISEPKYFNDYCINKLDEFVDSTIVLLGMDEQQKKLLEKEKIYYILCSDEKEIEQITGFNMRGQFITAMDGIITTYNTHYHELAHMLMNYKLKNLSLYTLPFFMEGFAVAVGGRGGMAKRVVLDIGYYLQKSGFLTYDSIISNDGFYKEDASLTYPVAGLYNAFLIKELGAKKYTELYKGVNGSIEYLKNIISSQINLQDMKIYDNYLKDYVSEPNIYIDKNDTHKVDFIIHHVGSLRKVDKYYKFSIVSPFIFSPSDQNAVGKEYKSKKFAEITHENENDYEGFKYGIAADSLSVSLYNFYTNEIIASYINNFSLNPQKVSVNNSRYEFFIKNKIFENDLDSMVIFRNGR